ncbi:protein of unknown function [Sporobacter termitidis DSM 10068]|uniref:Uncharacterized protein n=1 Tax=Sporobacter termitidis DSM 10068 TaxID=1123282 RepID=A0A1M5YDE0_9FIRM|nr:DUF4179 domain-containing protein [Sporobacter termitidis]SHI10065.1 protein of unknown function [Sporobacter termitidis DSM 10068]
MNNNIGWDNVFPEVSENFHQRIADTLKNAEGLPPRRKPYKKRFLLLLAAVLAIGTLTAGAVYIARWNDRLANRFEADETQQSALVSAGTAATVEQSASANGLTVTALQTIADKNGIYVLLDIKAPAGTALTDESCFEGVGLQIDGVPGINTSSGFWSDTELSESGGEKLPANERYYAIHAHNSNKADINGRAVTVGLTNLMTDKGKLQLEKVLDGKWELRWTLSAPDTSRKFDIDKVCAINGHDVTVKSLELSPISGTLTLDGKDMLAFKPMLDQLDEPFISYLLMKDGSFFALNGMGSGGWGDMGTDLYVRTASFDMLLKVDEVAGLVLTPPGVAPTADNALMLSGQD